MGVADFHVHFRGLKESDGLADYIGHALMVAERAGVDGVGDMPNTIIPITTRKLVVERLNVAKACGSDVFYGLHIGLTSDPEQICRAVDVYREFFPKPGDRVGVIGMKAYMGRSTGNLAIIDEDEQRGVYETLGKCGYEGVLVDHCEKESLMRSELWSPDVPWSHSFARPAEAEWKSHEDQIEFAYEGGFLGTLHFAHVTTPMAVDAIDIARRNYGYNDVRSMKITFDSMPHHLFLNYRMMKDLSWKVNPPLRSKVEQEGLLDMLKTGMVNVIASDHAPHLLKNKIGEPYMSGIPALDSWPKVIMRLRKEGFDDKRIRALTRENALRIYGIPEGVVRDSEGIGDLELSEYEYGYGDAI